MSGARLAVVPVRSSIDGTVVPPCAVMTPLPSIVTVVPSTLTPPSVPPAPCPAVGRV